LELGRAFVSLTKPRIIELLLVTTVPAMLLAERGVPPARLLAATLAGGAFAAGGANALNFFWDRDIDAKMSRTKRRLIVTGAVPPGQQSFSAWPSKQLPSPCSPLRGPAERRAAKVTDPFCKNAYLALSHRPTRANAA
jgi:hypothetical protein